MLTSHCARGCLQRHMGCSHCSVHIKKAILGTCSHNADVVHREASSYSGCFDYWSAGPESTPVFPVPHQSVFWFYLVKRLRVHSSFFSNVISPSKKTDFLGFLLLFMSLKINAIGHLLISWLGCLQLPLLELWIENQNTNTNNFSIAYTFPSCQKQKILLKIMNMLSHFP